MFVTAAMYFMITFDASVFPEPLSPAKKRPNVIQAYQNRLTAYPRWHHCRWQRTWEAEMTRQLTAYLSESIPVMTPLQVSGVRVPEITMQVSSAYLRWRCRWERTCLTAHLSESVPEMTNAGVPCVPEMTHATGKRIPDMTMQVSCAYLRWRCRWERTCPRAYLRWHTTGKRRVPEMTMQVRAYLSESVPEMTHYR